MAITYPLPWPTVGGAVAVAWTMHDVVASTEGAYDGAEELQQFPGQWLSARIEIRKTALPAVASAWRATLARLQGRWGTLLVGDPARPTPRGTIGAAGAGTPVLDGSHATLAEEIAIKGVTPGRTVLAADWLQLGTGATSTLILATADATADGAGDMTVPIFPRLRAVWANESPVTVQDCKGVFRLADNLRGWRTFDRLFEQPAAFEVREAF